jgi:hypothetical protein
VKLTPILNVLTGGYFDMVGTETMGEIEVKLVKFRWQALTDPAPTFMPLLKPTNPHPDSYPTGTGEGGSSLRGQSAADHLPPSSAEVKNE